MNTDSTNTDEATRRDASACNEGLGPLLQGGLNNAELLAAWMRKLPRVEPSERDLSAFANGVEVGYQLGLQSAAQVAQPDDSYQDEWFNAKADAVRRIRALLPPAA